MNNVAEVLHRDGVVLNLGTAVNEVHSGHVVLPDGSTIQTHCVIWRAAPKAAAVASGAGIPQGRGGRIKVKHDLSVEGFPGVYAPGDLANIARTDGKPDAILIGCGSEIGLCMQSRERLAAERLKARVVSMPAWTLFDDQDQGYRDSVLPPSISARLTVEEASPIGWDRYAERIGVVLGMRTFGMAAPMKIVAEHFGSTPEHVVSAAKETLARSR
jgi:hypothetical protein